MGIQFYDVKSRQKVEIPDSEIRKTTYSKEGSSTVRYAFRATHNGTNLTKFVKKEDWDSMNVPVE
jgi:predicted carbohydrate-binding protein with CBM5 and CBM33 domain